jgi:hypothetical protein
MKHGSLSDKSSLDPLVLDAKKIIRLAHEHAKICESFRNALKGEEAGHQPTPAEAQTANPHFAANEKRKTYLNG